MLKGQLYSVREIFSFLIGILLIASVFTIFSQILNDRIVRSSLNENLDNVVEQVRLGVVEASRFAEAGGEVMNLTYKQDLPSRIVNHPYSVRMEEDWVCAKVLDYEEVLESCGQVNLPPGTSTSSSFLSGTKLDIKVQKGPGFFRLSLEND